MVWRALGAVPGLVALGLGTVAVPSPVTLVLGGVRQDITEDIAGGSAMAVPGAVRFLLCRPGLIRLAARE